MRLLVALLIATSSGIWVRPFAAEPAAPDPVLAVPFLPQTEALCGGAAVAMVFRFWGERHADVQQFAALVDPQSGGIADTVLVKAVEDRGWRTRRFDGTIATLRTSLDAGRPPIVLIEDRPSRYHFVVVIAASEHQVIVHDPAWGPSRRFDADTFVNAWRPTGFWTVIVTPGEPPFRATPPARQPERAPPQSACDRAVDQAVETVRLRGIEAADGIIADVRSQCPSSSRPLSELAGVRLAQHRFPEAASLASQAVAIDRSDAYGWDILGSSRFVEDDIHGAIQAWNVIDRPLLDSVAIAGLNRTRYSRMATSLRLEPNRVLTADAFSVAARRVDEYPALSASRVSLAPDDDGWAVAHVAVVEKAGIPRGWMQWTVAGVRSAVDRDIRLEMPGWSGQGEMWSARWRWWQNRPAVSFAFAAPAAGRIGGVWSVDGSWMAQRYDIDSVPPTVRETRTHGGVTRTDWGTPDFRYEISAGLDAWDGTRQAALMAGRIEKRFQRDRVSLTGSVRNWWGLRGTDGFSAADARLAVRSSTGDRGFVTAATLGGALVTTRTPFSEWATAGDTDQHSPQLRAHPLTSDGIVDSDAFGRRLVFASIEQRRWLERPALVRLGLAAFVDAARAGLLPDGSPHGPLVVDAGVGVRIRIPGARAILRLDYGHGLRDSANVLTVGWQP